MKRIHKHRSVFSLICLVALALAACSSPAPQPAAPGAPTARPLTKISFRTNIQIGSYHAGFYEAVEQGYYADEGLDVTIGAGQGSLTTAQLVAAGKDDLGMTSSDSVARVVSKGGAERMVATLAPNSGNCVMVRADSGINTPKDLEGHTLGDAAGFVTLQVFPAFEAATGIDSSKVRKVTVDATARTTAFLARQYDVLSAIAFGEPVQARLQYDTDIKCMMFSDYGVTVMGFGIVASQQMIDQKPEIVKGFVRASTKGYAYAFAHPEEAAQVLRKRMPDPTGLAGDNVTVEVIRVLSTMGTADTEGKPYGYMPESLWVKTVDVLKNYADLDPATDPKALFTNFAFE